MKINLTYEQALQKASPRLQKQMERTKEILLKALPLALRYDPENGFYVGFSGGKDSQALYHMMQLLKLPMHAYFSPTSIDPPENIRFIKTMYPEVEFVKITENIFDLFRRMKVLPSMRIRYCCSFYKEKGGEGKVVCTGVRKAESVRRSKRNEIEVSGRKFSGRMDEFEDWQEKRIRKKMKNLNQDQFSDAKLTEVRCISGKDKILLNPIIEWSEEDVWEFLNKVVEVPHCELYDEGYTRIGCIGCPMATTKNQIKQFKRWPHVKEKWIRAIMDVRRESILANTPPNRARLTTSIRSTDSTPPTREQHNALDKELGWSDGHKQNITSPNFHNSQANTQECRLQGQDSHRAFSNCKTGYWKGVPIPPPKSIRTSTGCSDYSTPQRTLDGKFLDSDNGDCSAVVAEYDEQKEREIAEAIFDWWISKKPFKQWFAEKYQQGTLDFGEDNE